MSFFRQKLAHIDWVLILTLLPILAGGWITMSSFTGDNYFAQRQLVWILIVFIIMFLTSFIDWRFLRRRGVVVIIYLISIFTLVILFLIPATKGAQSWLSLGGISVQPADFMKIVLILTLSKYFSRRHVEIAHYRHILVSALYAVIPFFLILRQPDFGSAIIIISVNHIHIFI